MTWDDLDELAIGELGITPDRFERMTWREFDLNLRGYFLRLARQKWLIREVIWNMWALETPGGKEVIDRKDIMALPWDEPEPPRKEFTPQEIDEIRKRFEKVEKELTQSNGSN